MSFHADNIASIVDRIRTYEQFHQYLLWYEESQFVTRSAKLLAEVVDELFHTIKCLGIACECMLAEVFRVLFAWGRPHRPTLLHIAAELHCGKIKIMLCLSFVDEDTIFLITPHALAVERVGCILITFVT